MRGRIGAAAGIGFVVVGAVELALTGGPAPAPGAADAAVVFFTDEAPAAPAVAVLSAVAGAMLLVFAARLRRVVGGRPGEVAWGGAIAMLALALAGQAVQQTAWLTATELAPATLAALGSLVGFLFGFALVGGAILALATGVAAVWGDRLPGWLGGLGALAALVVLAGLANTTVAAVAFPAFLVWLLGTSIVLLRHGDRAFDEDTRPARPAGV